MNIQIPDDSNTTGMDTFEQTSPLISGRAIVRNPVSANSIRSTTTSGPLTVGRGIAGLDSVREFKGKCYFDKNLLPNHNGPITVLRALAEEEFIKEEYRTMVITGSKDGKVCLWKLDETEPSHLAEFRRAPLEGGVIPTSPVTAITTYIPKGEDDNKYCVIAGFEDGTLCIWKLKNRTFQQDPINFQSQIMALAAHNNSAFIVSALKNRIIHVTYIEAGLSGSSYSFQTHHTDLILGVAIVPPLLKHKMRIISIGWDKNMFLWEAEDQGNTYSKFPSCHIKSIKVVYVHFPAGEEQVSHQHNTSNITTKSSENLPVIITGSLDKTIIVWDYETKVQVHTLKGHEQEINAIKVSDRADDGSPPIIISGSADRQIILWDLVSGLVIRKIKYTEKITTLSIIGSKDGLIVLTTGETTTMAIWDLRRIQRSKEFASKLYNSKNEELLDFAPVTTVYAMSTKQNGQISNQILVGCVDGSFSVFDYHSTIPGDDEGTFIKGEKYRGLHNVRINAAVPYAPSGSRDINDLFVISADGDAIVKKWRLIELQDTRTSLSSRQTICSVGTPDNRHRLNVMTIGFYDPYKFGFEYLHPRICPAGSAVDISRPLILTAGKDRSIKIWDFQNCGLVRNLSPEETFHTDMIRSIVVHHPVNRDAHPLFLTGSYDKTARLWDLVTLTPLQAFTGVHTDYVFFVGLYDPHMQPFPDRQSIEKSLLTIVTTSYDGRIGIWNESNDQARKVIDKAHLESITALVIYIPNDSTDDPLIITGSIDRMIHIWNLFNYQKVQTLTGHSDRICWLTIGKVKDRARPVLFSGGDDGRVISWEDILYQETRMPLREEVNRAYESDRANGISDWPLMTGYAEVYDAGIFLENSNLFPRAVIDDRADFLYKFWDYLVIALPTIKTDAYVIGSSTDNNNAAEKIDILTLAIRRSNLPAVRIILLAWSRNLNQDMDTMLTQRLYHGMHLFPEKVLPELAKRYPLEFIEFLTSLRLIRIAPSLMSHPQEKLIKLNRYEVKASKSRVEECSKFWGSQSSVQTKSSVTGTVINSNQTAMNNAANTTTTTAVATATNTVPEEGEPNTTAFLDPTIQLNWLDRRLMPLIDRLIDFFERFYTSWFDSNTLAQPVTSLLVPFQVQTDVLSYYSYLELFIEVSDRTGNVDIFESEMAIMILQYFWTVRGRQIHTLAFVKFTLLLIFFLICMYSYQVNYEDHPAGVYLISAIAILLLLYYAYEERDQWYQMTTHLRSSSILHAKPTGYMLWFHHFRDVWNCVDAGVIFCGILGLLLRLGYQSDTPTGRAFLAITSVLMWFKVLYFLRPFAATGPLVAMILEVVREIVTFLVVLFCVLAGFAQALWLLSNNDHEATFGTVTQAFLSAFLYMLGQNVVADFTGTDSPYMATIFLVVFLIIMMILMLNLLIALMGDVFQKAREKRLALWRKERAKMILEECYHFAKDENLPPYLYVLKYSSEVEVAKDNKSYEDSYEKCKKKSNVRPFTLFERKKSTEGQE